MDYEKAMNYLNNDIDFCKLTILCSLIADDDIMNGMNHIQEITGCDEQTSKLLWCDMKIKYGTPETNPIFQAKEERRKQEAREAFLYRNNAECPYCHSKNTKKISGMSKAANILFTGVYSIAENSKEWYCNNCTSKF